MTFLRKTHPPANLRWAALFLIACATVIFWFASRKPIPVMEAMRSDLQLLDGRLFLNQRSRPFNGWMLERYTNGALRSRSLVANGLLNGVSEGWTPNRQIEIREYFVSNMSHGLRTKWYANGQKMSEGTIAHGKIEGVFKRWHENGVLAEEIQMKNGMPDGLSTAYYPDGSVKAKASVQNGNVIERKSWKIGECKSVTDRVRS